MDAQGVLADYAEAKERARLRRQANAEAHRLQMQDKAITIKPSSRRPEDDDEEEDSDDDKKPKEVLLVVLCAPGRVSCGVCRVLRLTCDAWHRQLDPDDPEFIRLYRERRMQELLASQR
jgi:rhodanese-related sulfurtransferase